MQRPHCTLNGGSIVKKKKKKKETWTPLRKGKKNSMKKLKKKFKNKPQKTGMCEYIVSLEKEKAQEGENREKDMRDLKR